jgi:hypothetical protein
MPAGEYRVTCEGAFRDPGRPRIELKFRVIDGRYIGTSLPGWISYNPSGVISPKSRYAKLCAIALGRPIDAQDDLNNPASIFVGLIFLAFVGFRKTEKPKGGKMDPGMELKRKDRFDGLRVHDLLSREEL